MIATCRFCHQEIDLENCTPLPSLKSTRVQLFRAPDRTVHQIQTGNFRKKEKVVGYFVPPSPAPEPDVPEPVEVEPYRHIEKAVEKVGIEKAVEDLQEHFRNPDIEVPAVEEKFDSEFLEALDAALVPGQEIHEAVIVHWRPNARGGSGLVRPTNITKNRGKMGCYFKYEDILSDVDPVTLHAGMPCRFVVGPKENDQMTAREVEFFKETP